MIKVGTIYKRENSSMGILVLQCTPNGDKLDMVISYITKSGVLLEPIWVLYDVEEVRTWSEAINIKVLF